MNYLDLTLPSPEANLACDEALLDTRERGAGSPVIRFWESPRPFVVLGHSNRASLETRLETCRQDQVPVLRRCTGGGTVLQGPGSLNYSLILPIQSAPELESITNTNAFIMNRHRDLLRRLTGKEIEVRGCTDLALGDRKISGNAQRRKRTHLLFHGTFLLDFDLEQVGKYLRFPSRQPEYRKNRPHTRFLARLDLDRETLKTALRDAWNASTPLNAIPQEEINTLVRTKYSLVAWNLKFP